MRWITHLWIGAVLGLLTLLPSTANAQWSGSGSYNWPAGNGGQRPGWNGGGLESYYGNGGHDYQPHWHSTQTPFGNFGWYGNGRHDYLPHQHIRTPFSYQGFSSNPWSATQSYYPPQPYYAPQRQYYAPW